MAEVGLLPFAHIAVQSPGRCSRVTEAVSANVNLPSRSCWPFSPDAFTKTGPFVKPRCGPERASRVSRVV